VCGFRVAQFWLRVDHGQSILLPISEELTPKGVLRSLDTVDGPPIIDQARVIKHESLLRSRATSADGITILTPFA
jgi:hypothetical protein